MKPRNKFERIVLEKNKKIHPITKKQIKWAFRYCIDHFAYKLPKGRTTCMDCGYSWILDKEIKKCTCPKCRAKLEVKKTFKRKILQKKYFTILTSLQEYQILRMFLIITEMSKGNNANYYTIEIGQYWWNMQGKTTVIAVRRTLGCYIDTFTFSSPMEIRNDNLAYQYVAACPLYPKIKTTDILKRNGLNGDLYGIAPTILIPALLSDNRVETLIKAERSDHLRYFLNHQNAFNKFWRPYKIAVRNGYNIKDISLWCDYVDALRILGKDIYNPKFLCVKDLVAEHDRRQKELIIREEKEEIKRKRKKAVENERLFHELKSKFFGVNFTDGTINIHVLESVQEYLEEGVSMHHCVFANEYYLKKDSLILSAAIEGKRIETIEVSLKTLEVVQSRGVCNKNTEYHDQIVNLVNANTKLIRQRMKTTT